MNTTENNKLIAEFMGIINYIIKENGNILEKGKFASIDYKNNWSDLMQVVEKIKPLVCESEFNYRIGKHLLNINKEAVYNACVTFIEWYNEQTAEKK